ncbi:MAG: hypothetical protein RLZ98_3739 [Pseudomonadota bacterium]|jgi:HlyD family secretion protein
MNHGSNSDRSYLTGLRYRLVAGLALCALFALSVFGWASTAKIAGAVIAPGTVVVEGSSKKVQHLQGGTVRQIKVKNGDRVAAGQLLLQLDSTQIEASLGIVNSQLGELLGRRARLIAERDRLDAIPFPAELEPFQNSGRIVEGERRLFLTRRVSQGTRKSQLQERISQLSDEISGSSVQLAAKRREQSLIKEELARVSDMFKRNLLPQTRVLSMQRDEARISGESGLLQAQIAKLNGQISEIRLQIGSLDEDTSSEAQKEIREIEGRISELRDRKIAAEDQLRRTVIRSPIDGIVHELSTNTVGGVVAPGEQLMLIVPDSDQLSIEVRIRPADIDQISPGQDCNLRFPAFNQRITPEMRGVVTRLAPDASREGASGAYYVARVAADPGLVESLGGGRLVPGMPVEVYIKTETRTVLSYVVKPLSDQFERAFRER